MTGLASACETRFMHINSLKFGTLTANSGNLAGFPASNLVSANRGNLWITKGNFTITSSNRTLYIIIGVTTHTITLTAASYTPTTLASHITARILAVTGTAITCSYTTGYKFRFFSSTSAFTLKLSDQTNAIWSAIGYLGSVDIAVTISTNQDGEIRVHTSEYLYYDLGYSMDISFFALLPQRDYANMLTSGGNINVKASNVNDINAPTLDINITPGDEATYYFLETDGNPVQYRYVWITITDISNPYGPNLVFSQLFMGGYTAFANRTVDFGFTAIDVDRALRTESQAGGLYFERYGRHRSFNGLQFSNLTHEQITELRQLFYDCGRSESLYLTLDGGNMHDDIYEYTSYGVFDGDPVIAKQRANYFDASFEFRSN